MLAASGTAFGQWGRVWECSGSYLWKSGDEIQGDVSIKVSLLEQDRFVRLN